MSHTLNNMGKHVDLKLKAEFMAKWIGIVYGTSHGGHTLWRRTIDEKVVGFSAVRWYCQGEIEIQIVRK